MSPRLQLPVSTALWVTWLSHLAMESSFSYRGEPILQVSANVRKVKDDAD